VSDLTWHTLPTAYAAALGVVLKVINNLEVLLSLSEILFIKKSNISVQKHAALRVLLSLLDEATFC
jgi:hypothetical protein